MWSVIAPFLTINLIIAVLVKIYFKLTCGRCRCDARLDGKVAIVTCASSGVGYETAKELAARGARVILACRNQDKGKEAQKNITYSTGNIDVHCKHLDLSSFASIKQFTDDIYKTEKELHILINTSGVFALGRQNTEDGLLLDMQVNYFGPFLLIHLLLPLLKKSAPSRIITISSFLHARGEVNLQNLNMEKETAKSYNDFQVHANSKLCNILMTLELSRQLEGSGVTINCANTGLFESTLTKKMHPFHYILLTVAMKIYYKSVWEGAQTPLYLAVAPEARQDSGGYFTDCRRRQPALVARDGQLAQHLFKVSLRVVHVKSD